MTHRSIWEVLGVAPTADEAMIRKAYAERLRVTHPEDDAAGFKTLRAAYEHALRQAKWRAARPDGEPRIDVASLGAEADFEISAENPSVVAVPDAPAHAPPIERPTREHRSARDEHMRARAALVHALREGAAHEDLIAALDVVLNSEAMQQIEVYSRTQEWLVALLHDASPASSPLITPVIRFFGWTPGTRVNAWAGPASLFTLRDAIAKEERVRLYLERIRDNRHEFNRAYREIAGEAPKPGSLRDVWSLRHLGVIDRFLAYTLAKFPSAMDKFDAARVARWRSRVKFLDTWHLLRNMIGIALILGSIVTVSSLPPPTRQRALADPDNSVAARESCRTSALGTRYLRVHSTPVDTFSALRADCSRALTLMPDSLSLRTYSGVIELNSGDYMQALHTFAEVQAVSPFDPVASYASTLAYSMDRAPNAPYSDQINLLYDALEGDAQAVGRLEDFAKAEHVLAASSQPPAYDTPPRVVAGAGQSAIEGAYSHFGLAPTDAGATLRCLAHADGRVTDCIVVSESPWNSGAAEMAVLLSASIRVQPATLNGEPLDGAPLELPFGFRRR